MSDATQDFLDKLTESFNDSTFVKLQLTHYYGTDATLQKVIIKPALIKKQLLLSFVFRHKTQDITKNHTLKNAIKKLVELIHFHNFRKAHLFTINQDYNLKLTMNTSKLKELKATLSNTPSLQHDHQKNRKIPATNKKYLHHLNITDKDGKVYKSTQDKFKQINHYIEILSSLLEKLPTRPLTHVVDMGAGKGYLTFALYDYLNHELKVPTKAVGVEFRQNLVDLCNDVATKSNFIDLSFVQGTIENYQPDFDVHVLIALHACDTATDEAIYKGISAQADLILVAPCCHHQIRSEIEKNKQKNELDFLLKHGVFLERQAEMVTDGIRVLLLELHGYKTKVFEFISDAHTPKNVLIVAERKPNQQIDVGKLKQKIQNTKDYFGIRQHHLEVLLGL